MGKKIKLRNVKTGKVRYFDEEDVSNEPISWEVALKQGIIPGIKAKTFSDMTEEEQKLFTDLGGKIEDDNIKK